MKSHLKRYFKLIKSQMALVLADSTMHGVSRIVKANICLLKLVWITFWLTCVSLFIYYSIKSIFDYYAFEVTTKIRKKFEQPTIFPTITICNKNMFTTDYGISVIEKTIDYLQFPYIFNLSILQSISLDQRFKQANSILRAAGNSIYYFSNENKQKVDRFYIILLFFFAEITF